MSDKLYCIYQKDGRAMQQADQILFHIRKVARAMQTKLCNQLKQIIKIKIGIKSNI